MANALTLDGAFRIIEFMGRPYIVAQTAFNKDRLEILAFSPSDPMYEQYRKIYEAGSMRDEDAKRFEDAERIIDQYKEYIDF